MTYKERGTVVAEQYQQRQSEFVTFAIADTQDDMVMVYPTYGEHTQEFLMWPGDYFVTLTDGHRVMRREVFEGLFEPC